MGAEIPQTTWTMPVQEFKTIHFVPKSGETPIRKESVREIHAVAHELLPAPGGNHWCLYLDLTDNRSVRIDATPSGVPGSVIPGGQKAYIVVSELAGDTRSQEVIQHVSKLSTRGGGGGGDVTVGDVLDVITQHEREKFEFNELARGCRHWTTNQIDLLLQVGLICDRAEAEQAKDDILTEYDDEKATGRRYPLTEGRYYH